DQERHPDGGMEGRREGLARIGGPTGCGPGRRSCPRPETPMSDKPRYLTTASVPVEWVPPQVGAASTYPWPELRFVRRAFGRAVGHTGEAVAQNVAVEYRDIAETLVPAP